MVYASTVIVCFYTKNTLQVATRMSDVLSLKPMTVPDLGQQRSRQMDGVEAEFLGLNQAPSIDAEKKINSLLYIGGLELLQ